MDNNSIEMALLEPEERELVQFIGLVREDPETGEMEYLEGDVDETEQLNYVLKSLQEEGRAITGVQIQLIQDAELQFGIQKGYYSEE